MAPLMDPSGSVVYEVPARSSPGRRLRSERKTGRRAGKDARLTRWNELYSADCNAGLVLLLKRLGYQSWVGPVSACRLVAVGFKPPMVFWW